MHYSWSLFFYSKFAIVFKINISLGYLMTKSKINFLHILITYIKYEILLDGFYNVSKNRVVLFYKFILNINSIIF